MKSSLIRVVLALDGPAHVVRHRGVKRTVCGKPVPEGATFGESFAGPECKACERILGLPTSPDVGCAQHGRESRAKVGEPEGKPDRAVGGERGPTEPPGRRAPKARPDSRRGAGCKECARLNRELDEAGEIIEKLLRRMQMDDIAFGPERLSVLRRELDEAHVALDEIRKAVDGGTKP